MTFLNYFPLTKVNLVVEVEEMSLKTTQNKITK